MASSFKDKYGRYAIVVGASAGIGEALAREIASRGVDLVLVARRLEKLEELSADLKGQHGIDVKCVSLDLLQDDAVDKLVKETESLDIGLLVINAAAVVAGGFLKNSYDLESKLITLNTLIPAQIAHRIGNRMKRQKRGGILFVSSLAGNAPTPFQATYAATKAYLSSLGQALAFEVAQDGIDVSVLAPGATDTEGLKATPNIDYSKMKGITMMSPADVAKAGIDGLGKQAFIIPGLKNRMSAFVLGMLPRATAVRTVGRMTAAAVDQHAL